MVGRNSSNRLEDYESLKPLLADIMKKEDKILVLGCGNAEFSEKMYDDGYPNISNIDISPVVIEQMKARSKDRKKMVYEVMDVRDLHYPNACFDLAIDKSTIDAILCGEQAFCNVAIMLKVPFPSPFRKSKECSSPVATM